ncbi:zinc finger and BTB domain-containing protein 49 isoform 2-T3 [Glossophaga mutica]
MDPAAAHGRHLLQQLHEQRIQGLLCDCTLVVRGVCFKAHKNVLAAFSQCFRSLFQNSSGQKNDVFHLDIKNVSGIGQILDFMYTSHLDLNQDNVQVMLDIAQCLQVQNVLNLCHTFLKSATVQQPPGTPCDSAFSPQSTLTPDPHCVVSESCSPHLLQGCAADAQHGEALDGPHARAPPPVHPHRPAGATSKQAPETSDGGSPELPSKQPSYYYKLRNLYSKQYYKQATCPSHERIVEQPFTVSPSADLTAAENQPSAASRSECALPAAEHLPANFLAQPPSEPAPDPEPDNTLQQPTKQMRLKKAIHLKKLNFLKSQKSAEQTSAPELGEGVTKRTDPASESTAEKASGQGAEDREGGELVGAERFNCVDETERPEELAALEDQPQMLQSQRQYACELCGKPFKHPSNLELHKRSHTGLQPLGTCSVTSSSTRGRSRTCATSVAELTPVPASPGFSNFSNLKEHKKTHTAEKVFTCDQCGKSFNMQRKLVKHRARHTGERPYSCAACGKCFGGSGDLRRHVRTHTGEKPYTCEICDKCFTRSAVLRRHRRMHCRPDDDEGPDALQELAHAFETSDLDKAQLSDSFSPDVSVPVVPASAKLPGRPAEEAVAELDGHPAGSCCKFRASTQPHGVSDQEKLGLDPGKLAKAPGQHAQHQAFAYSAADASTSDGPLPADGMATIRSSLATLDNHCGDALGGRVSATAYRNSEGPFLSSMTLWGLAMKALQSENELDQ